MTTHIRNWNTHWRWTSLVGNGLEARVAARKRLLDDRRYWTANTAKLQLDALRGLLSAAAQTEIGRTHKFARLARLDDAEMLRAYRAEIAVADWYAYRTQINRMRDDAEPDVLWPGVVMDFAQTSGTTAGDKFIPVSKAMMRSNYLASLDIFAHAWRFGISLPRMLAGKSLFLGGSSDLAVNSRGIRTGDLSGIVTPLIKWPLSEIYLPGKDVALMSDWPAKIEAMAQRCLHEDVRMISGMPSWMLVLSERMIELGKQRGLKSRASDRAGEPMQTLRDVWPNLTLLVHGGVRFTPFEPRVRQMYSGSPTGADVPNRLELYPASEAFVAIQDTRGNPGLRLLADGGNFFEFVPLEQVNDPNAPGFAAHEVEKGQKYVVTLTTCAGLWRYILGDVVEFDTIPGGLDGQGGDGPARLRIVGRHRHFINAFGENLIVEHIETAVSAAAAATGLLISEFTAAPVYPINGSRPGLELAVEIDGAGRIAPQQLNTFRDVFDSDLKRQNVDYTTKRTAGVGMTEPTISPLPPGTFHRWLLSKGKLGGQHKCPRCANHRDIIDAVKAAAQD